MNRPLVRAFLAVVAALVTWACSPLALASATPSRTGATVSVLTYDISLGSVPSIGTHLDRGPPAVIHDYTAPRLAVVAAPYGPAARLRAATTLTYTDYDDPMRLAQVADGSGTTRTAFGGRAGDTRVVRGAGVAANAGGDFSRILMISPRQLKSKFKHAGDFGVAGNYSEANAAEFGSGRKLSPDQLGNVLRNGSLGGG
jgi:hypothetical protein